MNKKCTIKKMAAFLVLASSAFLFTACKDSRLTKPTPKIDEDKIYTDNANHVKFKVLNKEAEITEIIGSVGEDWTIPATLTNENGTFAVTKMSATYTNSDIKSVTIPDSLVYLTGNGFMKCENLETVNFGANSSLAEIPSYAFLGTKLRSISIPKSVKAISKSAFQDVETLTTLTFDSESVLRTIGPFTFYGCSNLSSVSIPKNCETISESAFEKCVSLSTLSFSNAEKLSLIEQYAFSGCTALTTLDTSNAVNLKKINGSAFRECTNLENIKLDNNLEEIGKRAFYNTQNVSKLVLPSSLRTIGDEAFVNCGLENLTIESSLETVGSNAFTQYKVNNSNLEMESKITSLTINGGISLDKLFTDYANIVKQSLTKLTVNGTQISDNAFSGCVALNDVTLGSSIKRIGSNAFSGCVKIESIELPNINEIAKETFKGCILLENIDIPSSVEAIRDGAFDGCVKVTTLDLSNLTNIGANAFRNTNLSSVAFSKDLEKIGANAFENCKEIDSVVFDSEAKATIDSYAFMNCLGIETLTLADNMVIKANAFDGEKMVKNLTTKGEYGIVTLFGSTAKDAADSLEVVELLPSTKSIENEAFKGCLKLTTINIPDILTSIGDSAFADCKNLDGLVLPESLTKVGKYAFNNCSKLNISSLPSKVTTIEEGVFEGCESIEAFTINSTVSSIGNYAFAGCPKLTTELPTDLKAIGNYSFSGCTKLELDVLPANLISIGEGAFENCLSLTATTVGTMVDSIGSYAFSNCTSIKSFEFTNVDAEMGDAILSGCVNIIELKIFGTCSLQKLFGDSVEDLKPILADITIKEGSNVLADDMFNGFVALSDVKFDTEIYEIGANAFKDCISLKSIDLSTVLVVGDFAFSGSGLTSVVIPEAQSGTPIQLGCSVFANCASLCQVEINEGIKEILEGTFEGTILKNVTIPASVEAIDANAFANVRTLDNIVIADGSNLETIGSGAFTGCGNIKSIKIPSKVMYIGDEAFKDCIALYTVEFEDGSLLDRIGVSTFYGCFALYSINIPETVKEIADQAFYDCSNLVNVQLPSNLEVLGQGVFTNAKSINNIIIPALLEIIPVSTFENCLSLTTLDYSNANVKTIEEKAFFNTPYLSVIPSSVTFIGNQAFASGGECVAFADSELTLGVGTANLAIGEAAFQESGIQSLILGSSIIQIGSKAFYQIATLSTVDASELNIAKLSEDIFGSCEALTTITISNKITTIGANAFKACKALQSFDFTNIVSIGQSAFEGAEALAIDINLGTSTTIVIGTKAFFGSGISGLTLGSFVIDIGDNAFASTKITSADLSELGVDKISESFFDNCSNLETVVINSNVATICKYAFRGTAITNINFLPEGINAIEEQAFANCDKLLDATIPTNVRFIGKAAFENCSKLETVSWSTNTNKIEDNTFSGCTSIPTITIPENVKYIGKNVFSVGVGGMRLYFLSETNPQVEPTFITNDATDTYFVVPSAEAIETYKLNYVFATKADAIITE